MFSELHGIVQKLKLDHCQKVGGENLESRAFRVIRLRFRSTDVVWLVVLKEMCSGILPPSSQSTVF